MYEIGGLQTIEVCRWQIVVVDIDSVGGGGRQRHHCPGSSSVD